MCSTVRTQGGDLPAALRQQMPQLWQMQMPAHTRILVSIQTSSSPSDAQIDILFQP
jgi:hypothetical protein